MARPAERDAVFHPEFREDFRYWIAADRNTALRVFQLIEAIVKDPFTGIGKPEQLNICSPALGPGESLKKHRLVYKVTEKRIDLLQGAISLLNLNCETRRDLEQLRGPSLKPRRQLISAASDISAASSGALAAPCAVVDSSYR